MKTLKLLAIISGIVGSHSMYGMLQQRQPHSQNKFHKFDHTTFDQRDPKFAPKPLSQPVRDPNSRINGVLLHSVYGNTAKNPDHALADFEEARAMAQQSQRIGAPLAVGVFYNMPSAQKEATKVIYNGLEESSDKTQLSVLAPEWRKIGSDMPLAVRISLPNVTVGLQRNVDQKIVHLAAHAAQGASMGAGIAATISLANNGYNGAEKEITQLLYENKEKAFKHCIASIAKKMPSAIDESLDGAIKKLNGLDINPVGKHCDQTHSYEQTVFVDIVKQTGSVLAGEAIASATDYGKSLAQEQLPKTLLAIGQNSIKSEDVFLGSAIGASIGLVCGAWTMDDPIQKAPLNGIYCSRA